MGHPRPLFCLFLSFQTNITILTINKCENMSIQDMMLGLELMTFGTRASSHNPSTRAPAHNLVDFMLLDSQVAFALDSEDRTRMPWARILVMAMRGQNTPSIQACFSMN